MTTLVQSEGELHLHAEVSTASDADGGGAWFSSDHENVRVEDTGEGVLRITLRPGRRITAEDGALVRERYLALTGTGAAVLLQVIGVESVSRDAVRFFSEAATITAFAILGSTPVDRVIAHGRHGLPAPQCPTRYFSDEPEALGWLRELRAERVPELPKG
ncbi:DUF7793 family protein [Arthrobacter sp. 2MCAF14]|uniref:DUF7793 family protein n=1 Tax=Arthrobacter sp. 2MCAF14 TaxID=3232982 RepID=UPI003F927E1A